MAYPLLNELARHADDGALSFYYFLAAKLSTPNTVGARLWQRELPAECAALALSDIPKMRQSVRVLVRSRAQMDGVLELGAADDENEIAQILAMRDSCRVALENLLARLAENWLKQRVLHELSVAGATQNFEAEVLRHVRSFAATLRECGLDAAHIASTPSENQSRSASTVLGDEEPDYEFYAREAATAQALARLHLENDDEDLRLAFSILQRAAERLAGNDYRVAGLFVDAAKSAGEQGVLRDIWVTVSPRRRNKDAIHYDFDVASDKAGESLRRSVELAREAALSFLRRRCNHDADYAIKIHLDSSPDSLPLGGDSLGLAVALALIARVTGQTIGVQEAGDVAVTGAIVSSDGTIGAVGGIEEKLRAAQREMDESTAIRATRLRRVVVPADNCDEVPAPLQNAVSFAADLESLLAAGVLFDPLRPYLQRLAGAQSFSSTQLDAAQELWNRHYKVALFKRFYDDEKPVAIEIARRLAAQRLEGGLNQKNVARIPIVLDMARDVATNASWLDIIAAAVRRAVGAEPDESLLRVTLHDCGFAFILTGLDGDAALPFLQPSGQLAELRARYPHNQIIPVCSAATWQRRAPEFGDEWKNTLALYEGRSTILDRHVEAVTRRWNERVLHLFNVESGAATFYLPQQTRALDDAGGQSTPLENLLDAAPRCHLLLGESGAGKTTALHRWFFHALEIGRFTTLYLPADAIKAAFATSASSDATMNFLAAICNHAPVPVAPEVLQSQLERMPLLLLLDDLDEVADAAILDQLLSLISFLDNHNPVVRVVIACNRSRTTDGVLQKLLNRRAPPFFESRELLPLDLPSAQEVWTQLIGVERAREVAEEIESQRRAVSVRAAPRDEHGREPVVGLRPADDDESFKDRVEVIAQLRALLQDRSVKLVCIIGRGGIGKTALLGKLCGEIERGALQLSGDAKNVIGADGILYASCRGDDAPSVERIFHDAARMLGSPQSDELLACWNNASCSLADKIRFLLGKLRAGYYLLVLDNLEDALAPDNTLRDEELRLFLDLCLSTPHALRVLTTSREQIEVNRNALRARRQVFLDALPETDAATLLRELDVDGDLGLRVASEEQLREAARRCYGVPRALESGRRYFVKRPDFDAARTFVRCRFVQRAGRGKFGSRTFSSR